MTFIGAQKERKDDYDDVHAQTECSPSADTGRRHYRSCAEWNDPRRTVFSLKNVALDRFLYSWGYGLRIQIPALPIRIYYAQKRYYAGGLQLLPIPGDRGFDIVFSFGDYGF